MREKHEYDVIVGNIGTVYSGTNGFEAIKTYNEYKAISKAGTGRAGGENISLFKDNEIYREHMGDIR